SSSSAFAFPLPRPCLLYPHHHPHHHHHYLYPPSLDSYDLDGDSPGCGSPWLGKSPRPGPAPEIGKQSRRGAMERLKHPPPSPFFPSPRVCSRSQAPSSDHSSSSSSCSCSSCSSPPPPSPPSSPPPSPPSSPFSSSSKSPAADPTMSAEASK